MDSLQELTKVFARDFAYKKSIIHPLGNSKKNFIFEHKIKSQIDFCMKMTLEKENLTLARANSTILEIRKDLKETTEIVKNSMVQLLSLIHI